MNKSDLKNEIRRLWKLYEHASTRHDQQGLLAEIAWLEHKLNQ